MTKSPAEANDQHLTPELLLKSLEAEPGLDKRQLVSVVRSNGLDTTHRDVNRLLYGHPELFRWEQGAGARRLWYAQAPASRQDRKEDTTQPLVLSKHGRWSRQ